MNRETPDDNEGLLDLAFSEKDSSGYIIHSDYVKKGNPKIDLFGSCYSMVKDGSLINGSDVDFRLYTMGDYKWKESGIFLFYKPHILQSHGLEGNITSYMKYLIFYDAVTGLAYGLNGQATSINGSYFGPFHSPIGSGHTKEAVFGFDYLRTVFGLYRPISVADNGLRVGVPCFDHGAMDLGVQLARYDADDEFYAQMEIVLNFCNQINKLRMRKDFIFPNENSLIDTVLIKSGLPLAEDIIFRANVDRVDNAVINKIKKYFTPGSGDIDLSKSYLVYDRITLMDPMLLDDFDKSSILRVENTANDKKSSVAIQEEIYHPFCRPGRDYFSVKRNNTDFSIFKGAVYRDRHEVLAAMSNISDSVIVNGYDMSYSAMLYHLNYTARNVIRSGGKVREDRVFGVYY